MAFSYNAQFLRRGYVFSFECCWSAEVSSHVFSSIILRLAHQVISERRPDKSFAGGTPLARTVTLPELGHS